MVAEILDDAPRLQPLRGEPALGRRLDACSPRRGRRARPLRGRRGGAARGRRARCSRGSIALGNLFRDQLDRYGELELVAARWREMLAALPETTLVVNADDPLLGELARGARRAVAYGLDDPAHGRAVAPPRRRLDPLPALRRAARLPDGLRRPPRRLPLPSLRPRPAAARRRARARSSSAGSRAARFTLATAGGLRPGRALAPGPLQRLQRDRRGGGRDWRSDVPLERIVAGLERFVAAFGRFERIAVGDKALLMLLIKNPAGANEAVATLLDGSPPVARARRAQRRDRRRAGRLLDLGRRLRAAARRARAGRRLRRPGGGARAPLRLRRARARADRGRARRSRRRSTARSS